MESILSIVKKELEEVADVICDQYCKYPDTWDEEKEEMELSESPVCEECPIRRLL